MVNRGVRLEEDGIMDNEEKFGNECLLFPHVQE